MPTAMRTGPLSAILVVSLLCSPALAATAHNSQAGAYGPRKNNCEATAYFPADSGCLGSYLQRGEGDDVFPPPGESRARYRPRPPLQ